MEAVKRWELEAGDQAGWQIQGRREMSNAQGEQNEREKADEGLLPVQLSHKHF